jgi:hypothetical protein
MLRTPVRSISSILVAALLLSPSSFAFDTSLSDQTVREAYFLGQRHDESMARLLSRYTRYLPPPESGPHIFSVAFLTPFALLVRQSSRTIGSSAQQAEKDHRVDDEIVVIRVEILLTQSYGSLIAAPTSSRSGSPLGYRFRSPGFWRDFSIHVFDGENALTPVAFSGEPNYLCAGEGGCVLTGATIHLQFPAGLFTSDSANIQVLPPEGPEVSVAFDLTRLR